MADIARKMGVSPQQLYPIANRLTEDGRITKRRGGGYAIAASDGRRASAPKPRAAK